jgi:hypothetical protein
LIAEVEIPAAEYDEAQLKGAIQTALAGGRT